MKEEHPERHADHISDELINAAVGPSGIPLRNCPFCPIMFSDVSQMQNHIAFHLERLALIALPPGDNGSDDGECSVQSGDSRQPFMRGRQRSLNQDFIPEQGLFISSIYIIKANYILDIRQIPCDLLRIGSWNYVKKNLNDLLVFYSQTNSIITYYVKTDLAEYKMEYSFKVIDEMIHTTGGLTVILSRAPTFSTRTYNQSGNFHECADFTDNRQACQVLAHELQSRGKREADKIMDLMRLESFKYRKQAASEPALEEKEQIALDEQRHPMFEALGNSPSNEHNIDVDLWLSGPEPIHYFEERDDDSYLDSDDLNIWADSNEWNTANEIASLGYVSQLREDHNRTNVDPIIVPSQVVPREFGTNKILFDPDCAICHSSAAMNCDCVAKYLEIQVHRAEQKTFEPCKQDLRDWVRGCAEKSIVREFELRVKDIKQDEDVITGGQETKGLVSQNEYSKAWAEYYQRHPDVMDYFYSLVDVNLPGDDEEKVRDPPFFHRTPAVP